MSVRKGPLDSEGPGPRSAPNRGPTDGVLSELLKRVVEAGAKNLSAEPMRQLLAEMKIPKDALLHLLSQHLLLQLEESKQNVYRLVARELKVLLERTYLADEIAGARGFRTAGRRAAPPARPGRGWRRCGPFRWRRPAAP